MFHNYPQNESHLANDVIAFNGLVVEHGKGQGRVVKVGDLRGDVKDELLAETRLGRLLLPLSLFPTVRTSRLGHVHSHVWIW